VFFDEVGFSLLEKLGRTWAPRGRAPLLRRVTRDRRILSTAVGLTLSGKIYKRHFQGAMDSADVIETLRYLQRCIPGKFILLWDHAKIHVSHKTTAYLANHRDIIVEWLPSYAPELNPEEYCHGNVKQHLRNATPADKQHLRAMVNRRFAKLRHRPDLILSFVHMAGLSVRQLWLN
jgi:transposase